MADKPTLPPHDPFPGSRTPGWNDPPTLQFNPTAATVSGRTRLNLNKRVAFPLQGTPSSDPVQAKPTAIVPPNVAGTTHPIAIVHPMPKANVPVPPPATASPFAISESPSHRIVEPIVLPADAKDTTLRILRDQIILVQESLNVRHEEIQRRLGVIEQSWETGGLDTAVQEKLFQLAKYISDKKFNEAMETYTSIVVDHSTQCGTWAVALRHIVRTLQVNSIEPNTSSSSATGESSNVASIPSMFVPAMPRQVSSNNETSTHAALDGEINNPTTTGYSSVQHI